MTDIQLRSAGILLHIVSLPSPYGIGDLGPEAYSFVDFLHRTRQSYWQVLPLTPIQLTQNFSPYSSISSMAGNTFLISPDELTTEGYLEEKNVLPLRFTVTDHVQYPQAAKIKSRLFEIAFQNSNSKSDIGFERFCNREAYWLDDFVLFITLKEYFGNKPWFEWPDSFRNRNLTALLKFTGEHQEKLTMAKWLQYIFTKQWQSLKAYCNGLGIKIIGDLPFYMNHDSVDVWTRREIFDLDEKNMRAVAGVPPDYFNADGQLWGMPVYRWDVLKSQRYDWWLQRIRKNLELVDVLRLDHFRAFESYWEVPSESETAASGKWKPGPGHDFFSTLKTEFASMPFVAEDLGDISPQVHHLRDVFGLPGMKVLQFAFGDTLSSSPHAPHNFRSNFFAYTGTHDNNTTRGWFNSEVTEKVRVQLARYAGCTITEHNVHQFLSRLAYASVARTVVIPAQDILGLDSSSRMNTPASTSGNWQWRLTPGQLNERIQEWIIQCMDLYGRANRSCSNSV